MIKYCKYCGAQLQFRPINLFNEETGERIHEMRCMNVKCEIGCPNNGGHQFRFFGQTCKRCGTFLGSIE